jgi:hypothetical protein
LLRLREQRETEQEKNRSDGSHGFDFVHSDCAGWGRSISLFNKQAR